LLCISCKREVTQSLAFITGFRAEELQVSINWAAETGQFSFITFIDLRSIIERSLAIAAISYRAVYLMHALQGDTY
jgi:hypothetical protein